MPESNYEQWLADWCQRSLDILRNWEDWAKQFQLAALGAPVHELEVLVNRGQNLTQELHALMSERQQVLLRESLGSLREFLGRYAIRRTDLWDQIKRIESAAVRVRHSCASQWVAMKQSSNFVDELLFIFRSGNNAPATYSDDEQEAFQGGFLLDSTA